MATSIAKGCNTKKRTAVYIQPLDNGFYARKQNASRVFAIVWASVRLSVCHTRELYQNGAS